MGQQRTNFGYNPELGHTAGEFGHNDFYSVAVAAASCRGATAYALKGMVLLDESAGGWRRSSTSSRTRSTTWCAGDRLRGDLRAMMGAASRSSAIGMVVALHPFRAIRAGKQLSDSKGASGDQHRAVLSVKRSMAGFMGPRHLPQPRGDFPSLRGPGQLFRKVESAGTGIPEAKSGKHYASPFDLVLGRAGTDFAVMGMHFKLGLYEHQSAGALQGLINLLSRHPRLLEDQTGDCISKIVVRAYEPAFGIIGDPAKRDPKTRQSADHSMLYLVCTKLRKALELRQATQKPLGWKELMLLPSDFSSKALHDPLTRELMGKMEFEWGGAEYDAKYPDGIPTSMVITDDEGGVHDSGLVMYPGGHARNSMGPDKIDLNDVLDHKFERLASLASQEPRTLIDRLRSVDNATPAQLAEIYDFPLEVSGSFE